MSAGIELLVMWTTLAGSEARDCSPGQGTLGRSSVRAARWWLNVSDGALLHEPGEAGPCKFRVQFEGSVVTDSDQVGRL